MIKDDDVDDRSERAPKTKLGGTPSGNLLVDFDRKRAKRYLLRQSSCRKHTGRAIMTTMMMTTVLTMMIMMMMNQ